MNVISKIFTRILFSRLTHWCDVTQNISESQAGGRSGYSTIDNIFCLQAVVQKYITKKRGRFYILFIDFCKAYDSVNRQKLWEILVEKGLKGKMLNMLKSIHENVSAAVKVGDSNLTKYSTSRNGLKQGCILIFFCI